MDEMSNKPYDPDLHAMCADAVAEVEKERDALKNENYELRCLLHPDVVKAAKAIVAVGKDHPVGCCSECTRALGERDEWKSRFEQAKIEAGSRCDEHCQAEVAKVEAKYARLVEAVKQLRAIPTLYWDNCGDIMRGYHGHENAKAGIDATRKIDAALHEIEEESK